MEFHPEDKRLKLTETAPLALELSNQQIKIIANNPAFGGEVIAKKLKDLRDVVWSGKLDDPKQKAAFENALEGLDPKQKEQFLASYARMGHLYEIASISARANYFDTLKNDKIPVPGGVEELVERNRRKSVGTLVTELNKPVFEITMTAHPTNVNSLESMQAQRAINKALANHNQHELAKAITHYQKIPILHQVTNKVNEKQTTEHGNLKVPNETKIILSFLGNIYEDLPGVYKNYDKALNRLAKAKSEAGKNEGYDPSSLNLKIKLGAWGSSGDKDGNNSVTAETTLEAIALHTQAILTRYSEDLAKINSPSLSHWQTSFEDARKSISELLPKIQKLADKSQEGDADFDRLSQELAKIRNSLNGENFKNKNQFENDLQKVAKDTARNNDNKDGNEALNLLRRFRTFGFNFSKIEYRETAKQYSRVVDNLIYGYQGFSPEEKIKTLTRLLTNPSNKEITALAKNAERLMIEGKGKDYSNDDATPIAYHTLKRMQLARDFGDMIKDNVLAECGQLNGTAPKDEASRRALITQQGVINMLEAQLLQRAVQQGDKRPKLGIIPLFEEPDTLQTIDKVMGAIYENKAYKQHLQMLKEENGTDKQVQQLMIAHSDNARRSGMQAARAYIHTAHHKMRKLNEERVRQGKEEIKTEFFEGGSISDIYRNGVRPISKSVEAFGLHDFAKFTFQGGDLLNFFNHPDSTARMFERTNSHQVAGLERINKEIQTLAEREFNVEVEKNVNRALHLTLDSYQRYDLGEGQMGVVLAALNYERSLANSNTSSRAGSRNETKTDKAFRPVPVGEIRTIGLSNAWSNGGIVASWIGSKDLEKHLNFVFSEDNNRNKVSPGIMPRLKKDETLTPELLHKLYQISPTFQDAQYKSALGLTLTDMDSFLEIARKNLEKDGWASDHQISGSAYIRDLHDTYKAAAKLSYASLTGESILKDMKVEKIINNEKALMPAEDVSELSNKQIRNQMIDAITRIYAKEEDKAETKATRFKGRKLDSNDSGYVINKLLKDDIINKTNYRAAILEWDKKYPDYFYNDRHTGRIVQSARDTFGHGRWAGASDPSHAVTYAMRHQNSHQLQTGF